MTGVEVLSTQEAAFGIAEAAELRRRLAGVETRSPFCCDAGISCRQIGVAEEFAVLRSTSLGQKRRCRRGVLFERRFSALPIARDHLRDRSTFGRCLDRRLKQ